MYQLNAGPLAQQLKVIKDFARKEIPDFVRAHMVAEAEHGNRWQLMNIYERVMMDGNLTRDVQNRKSKVLGETFSLLNRDGNRDDDRTKMLNQAWFTHSKKGFVSYVMDAVFYGYSLIGIHREENEERPVISCVERRNVNPTKGLVLRRPTDRDGLRIEDFLDDYILVNDDLGLLLKATPLVFMKRDMREYWLEHGEIFGMDMLVGKTDTDDPEAVRRMKASLRLAGRERNAVIDHQDELEPKEAARSDAYKIYQEFIKDTNQELSRLIKGHDSESQNYSESDMNQSEAEEIAEADKETVVGVVNTMLLPLLAAKGGVWTGVDQLTFQFDQRENTPLSERRNNIIALVQAGYDIDPDDVQSYLGLPFSVKKMGGLEIAEDTL